MVVVAVVVVKNECWQKMRWHSFMIQEAGMFQLLFLHVGHQLVAFQSKVPS